MGDDGSIFSVSLGEQPRTLCTGMGRKHMTPLLNWSFGQERLETVHDFSFFGLATAKIDSQRVTVMMRFSSRKWQFSCMLILCFTWFHDCCNFGLNDFDHLHMWHQLFPWFHTFCASFCSACTSLSTSCFSFQKVCCKTVTLAQNFVTWTVSPAVGRTRATEHSQWTSCQPTRLISTDHQRQ